MDEFSDETFQKTTAYWAALGRFIHYFSQVEQKLQTLLWHLSGTSFEVARAAFQDARHGTITVLINRINASVGKGENASYRIAVDRLGPIARLRNDLVHLAPTLEGDTATISTMERAVPGKGVETRVSAETLDEMSSDLLTIMAYLSIFSLEMQAAPDALKLEHYRLTTKLRAWRYKPPSQSATGPSKRDRPRRGSPQGQKPPRAPSRGSPQ